MESSRLTLTSPYKHSFRAPLTLYKGAPGSSGECTDDRTDQQALQLGVPLSRRREGASQEDLERRSLTASHTWTGAPNGRGSTPAHACAPRSPPHPLRIFLPCGAMRRAQRARAAPRVIRLVLLLGVMTCGLPDFTHGAWDPSTPLMPPPACTSRPATLVGVGDPAACCAASGRTRLRHTGRLPDAKGAAFPNPQIPSDSGPLQRRVGVPAFSQPYHVQPLQREATGRRVDIVRTEVPC
jgi:hypothetical protein